VACRFSTAPSAAIAGSASTRGVKWRERKLGQAFGSKLIAPLFVKITVIKQKLLDETSDKNGPSEDPSYGKRRV
jgi:hypothetical protein